MAIYIVQFTHPGAQHTLSPIERRNGIKEWNTGEHRRKYMIAEGQYVINGGAALSTKQDLLFWGEWEPMSKIVKTYHFKDYTVNPKYLHSPFLKINKKGLVQHVVIKGSGTIVPSAVGCGGGKKVCCNYQNTDPFVFDDSFYYSCCKQSFRTLRQLDPGSIILFGSTIMNTKYGGPCFAIDTVFVVDDRRDYTAGTYKKDLAGFIPPYYDQIMGFNSWANPTQPYTCYKGASFRQPIDGMFSYVPCHPADNALTGFPRVILKKKDFCSIVEKIAVEKIAVEKTTVEKAAVEKAAVEKTVVNKFIVNNLSSAPKINPSSLPYNKAIWDAICQIVKSQNFELGVRFWYK